jgi:integrase
MARKLHATIENRTNRLKLDRRPKPYGLITIAPRIRLGYRRTKNAGTWVVEAADGRGGEWQKAFALADDYENADGTHVLDFWQAADKAKAIARGQAGAGPPVTVAAALDDYEADLRAREGDPINASRVRFHLPPGLSDKPVALLGVAELKRWRNGLLAKGLKPSSVARTLQAARAAFNHAADQDPARIHNRDAWRIGLGGLTNTYNVRNTILTDAEVLRLVEAAYALDPALGLWIETAAVTGARSSQLAALLVADLQASRSVLTLPSSRKGRGQRQITRRPVPITAALAAKLRQAAGARASHAPLLVRRNGQPWNPQNQEHLRIPFARIAKQLGLDCTPYALRHSSIVRQLLANVPIRVVAAGHDTSVAMLERTYSVHISDHSDAIARRGLLDTSPAGENVVSLPGRR